MRYRLHLLRLLALAGCGGRWQLHERVRDLGPEV